MKCAKDGNANAISDAMSGFAMSRAALDGRRLQREDQHQLRSRTRSAGDKMLKELADWKTKADKLEKEIRETLCRSAEGFDYGVRSLLLRLWSQELAA